MRPNIARDLYRKRSQGRTDEEVFELDPDDGQDSVAVTESETGFNVGTEKYETAFDNSGTSIQDGAADTDKESAEERFARMKAEAEAKMEDSTPYLSEAFTAGRYVQGDGFRRPLENRPAMAWKTDGQNLAMKTKKTVCALLMLTIPCFAFAKSGAVNYSWGADALATHARLRGDDDAVRPFTSVMRSPPCWPSYPRSRSISNGTRERTAS